MVAAEIAFLAITPASFDAVRIFFFLQIKGNVSELFQTQLETSQLRMFTRARMGIFMRAVLLLLLFMVFAPCT